MYNFTFKNPTKLIFGKGMIAKLAGEIPAGAKIMMTYGGGSIFKNGVYEQVKSALQGRNVVEFGGIEANPDYDTLTKAMEICKAEKVDFLLAVGGGSVVDGTKFIAAGLKYAGDPWEFIIDNSLVGEAVPLACVLTLPATGTEMNGNSVVSRRSMGLKFAFASPSVYPVFSILDPQTIFSLPKQQIANGVVDTFEHTFEQYLTINCEARLMDRWSEGIFKTLIEIAPVLIKEENDYDTCANFMLTATMGLNGFVAMGVPQDWATHGIGHELTALHGLDHAQSLAVVRPGVMRVMKDLKREKLIQYAERVWGATGTDDQKIEAAIANTENFYHSIGMKTRLSEYGIGQSTIDEIVARFTQRGTKLGEGGVVTLEKVKLILTDRL